MKKKLLILFAAIFGMMLHAKAQTPFAVKTPPFKKFVKLTSNDVNLRKSPSTQSSKLIFRTVESDLGGTMESMVWSSKPLARNERAVRATVLPVWEKSVLPSVIASNDWICGHYERIIAEYHEVHDRAMVYVMKKFCQEVPLRSLTLPAPKSTGFSDIVKIESGKYKDYCIGTTHNEIGEKLIRLGKYVNGMFVFNYYVYYSLSNSGKTEYINSGDSPTYLACERGLLNSDDELNLKKLLNNPQLLDKLMTTTSDNIHNYVPITYYGVAGDNNWYYITGVY